jgi:undecaprenyl diphosphate synthase
MSLFKKYALHEADELDASNIRVNYIGRIEELPKPLQRILEQVKNRTEKNTGPSLQIALNYGGTQEIVDATNSIMMRGEEVNDKSLAKEVFSKTSPPDLIIRTGGEMRTSGFMPLATYAEWSFSKTLWPDFTSDEFDSICCNYQNRERRFGGIVKKTA